LAETDQDRVDRIVAGLVRDGLAVEEDETLRLP
ncbi:MAG: A/G-specific adenine glycosylase, partial [Actinobacteria bacterium]|nr:A/G-specific adenine glycosylase [Actinomycetota bacterium]